MKNYTNELNIKNERNIMSTNSLRNAGTTAAPGPGHWLTKCKMLLWLALPLTLAAGCASNPNRAAVADNFFTDYPVPTATPVSQSEAANRVIAREMFFMFIADTSTNMSMSASVNGGVVTLGGDSFDGVERQSIVDQTWGLAGVIQVKDDLGVDLPPTPKAIAAR